jgi:hypothetical protein
MKSKPKPKYKRKTTANPDWKSFGPIEPIKQWSLELKKAISQKANAEQWSITGRAAMILQEDGAFNISLLSKIASASKMNLIHSTCDDFVQMVNSDSYPTENCPTLIYIPQGKWSATSTQESPSDTEILNFRKTLPAYLGHIPSEHPIVFITSGEAYADLNESLRRVGLFDRRFLIPPLSLEAKGEQFIDLVGRKICSTSLISHPGKIGKLLNISFDDVRRQELIALGMKRLHAKKSRKLEFDDLVYFSIHGSVETQHVKEANKPLLSRIAIHEAGHALVAVIDSNGANIPEYLTVLPFENNAGLACDSYAYYYGINGQQTYKSLRHKIRVQLAGRAAEEIIYGAENIGAWGPRSDLVNATKGAKKLIAICGFSSNMEDREFNMENLAVIDEDASPAEDAYVVKKVRRLLSREYAIVRELLESNRPTLIAIKAALLKKMVLNQVELKEIIELANLN